MNSKQVAIFLFALLVFAKSASAQTLPISVLPKSAQKMLRDYVFVKGDSFPKGRMEGWDSLQFFIPKMATTPPFHINRFEISNAAYREFCEASGEMADRPDSTIWVSEFPYSWLVPIEKRYFSDPFYDSHPVVCVSWEQAIRYCQWKSRQVNKLLRNTDFVIQIRLPSETEWESAAIGINHPEPKPGEAISYIKYFPWEGPYLKGKIGKKFNFQCNGGKAKMPQDYLLFYYADDGYQYTAPVQSYAPNEFGLYQMAGNAAEWTSENYSVDSVAINKAAKAHPEYLGLPEYQKWLRPKFPLHKYDEFKIVKGGSWFDEPFYMQIGVRRIHHPKRASATIGFRPVCIVGRKKE